MPMPSAISRDRGQPWATAVRHYGISRVADGALLARAHVLWVFIDLATGRPCRIPTAFLAAFAPNVAQVQPTF